MNLVRDLLLTALFCSTICVSLCAAAAMNKTAADTSGMQERSSGLLPELSDLLIAPNTRWCGRGTTAGKYNHLGGASSADKCCRKHDHCQMNIAGLQRKWDLFNYRPFTLSHCSCDMRFRMCLKMANTPDSSMVGKLFFNMVQTQCFVIKTEKVCQQRSNTTNVCEKYGVRRKAYLRNNKKF